MGDSNTYTNTIFRYDLDAYGYSVKEKDFKNANIFANRIMSNAALFDTKGYGIIGHILKEIAVDGMNLQQTTDVSEVPTYAKESSKVVGQILKELESGIDLNQIWNAYNNQQISTHHLFMIKIEKSAYLKPDTSFSNNALDKLISYMNKNKKLFLYRPNNFIIGILNEIGRIGKVHNLNSDDEHFVSLLRMLYKIDDYVKHTSASSDFSLRVEKEVLPFVDKIINTHNLLKKGDATNDDVDDLLWSMIKTWRNYFVKFIEPNSVPNSIRREQETTETPEATELIKEITKHIEEEAGLK